MIAILGRSAPPDTALARKMLQAAPHRGRELTVRICGNCVLGVSQKANFPDASMAQEGPYLVAFSGVLDNASELEKLLGERGASPTASNPAAVVAAAFGAFGAETPTHLRGVFSAAVSDGHQLWCFRDPIGFRPLFYRHEPEAFFAALEVKQIIAGAGLAQEPDLEVLERIFYGRMPSDTPSALKGVCRLSQGTTMIVGPSHKPAFRRYWDPAALLESSDLDAEAAGERFEELFALAIDRRLTGHDAVSLSGGIDSPAVAAFAAGRYSRRTGRPLKALSAIFPDFPTVDESSYIELIAEFLAMELHTFTIEARALDDVSHWCQLLDGPVPIISVPEIHENYALAHRLDIRNLLTGEFAEFVFGTQRHLVGHLLTHGHWQRLARLLATERRRGKPYRRLAKELLLPLLPGRLVHRYLRARGRDRPRGIPVWMDRRKLEEVPYRSDLFSPAGRRWPDLQLLGLEGSTITMEADELCASLNGVTVRRPFADIDLWEFFLSLRCDIKFPDLRSKTFVKTQLRGRLPDAILDRRDKTYFDDYVMSQVDYEALRRCFTTVNHPLDGIDYAALREHIDRGNFDRFDWLWAKDLARIHAFLSRW